MGTRVTIEMFEMLMTHRKIRGRAVRRLPKGAENDITPVTEAGGQQTAITSTKDQETSIALCEGC